MADNEISSISDLLRILTNLGEPAEGHTRFFRGQGNADWEVLPGIYRNQKLIENEDKIIKEALLNCPDDFSPTDTLLEKLVKLQHYGYPTRLLDLTANALVSLYFSCSNIEHHDKDGELIVLDIPNKDIKYDDSDTVAVLAALSLLKSDFKISIIQDEWLVENILNFYDQVSKLLDFNAKFDSFKQNQTNETIKNSLERYQSNNNIPDDRLLDFLQQKMNSKFGIEYFNTHKFMQALISIIRNDKYNFQPIIDVNDLKKILCVKTKFSNSRISRQLGSFLLFGLNDSKKNPAKVPQDWYRRLDDKSIMVKADYKANILRELNSFGVSKQTLFPELESQASEIIAQYCK